MCEQHDRNDHRVFEENTKIRKFANSVCELCSEIIETIKGNKNDPQTLTFQENHQ